MAITKHSGVDLDEIKEWVGAYVPIILLIIFFVFLFKWTNHQSQLKDQETKARQQQLINSTNTTRTPPTYNAPNSSSGNYESNHGTEDCTSNCSGHDAGYDYADENNICDTEYSDGNSDSFNEGVIAWAEDNC